MTANRAAFLDDGDVQLYHGDAITVLQSLPNGIAQTCVTSPPYWGLRDYGTGTWTGGDAACGHTRHVDYGKKNDTNGNTIHNNPMGATCDYCGAQRVDSQLGLEASPDLYVERMVSVFREVRRVLRDDATLWLNLGDSYAASGPAGNQNKQHTNAGSIDVPVRVPPPGLKPKDLVGIPWRVAFALQADGWYLRSDIIWAKPNPMPESVTDRPTKAHEYLFLLTKQPRYFYDADAIREPNMLADTGWVKTRSDDEALHGDGEHAQNGHGTARVGRIDAGRNRRSVWTIPTEPFPDAHFATYPQALVTPCILAGTSEKGECAECGAPWRREVEVERVPHAQQPGKGKGSHSDRQVGHHPNHSERSMFKTGLVPRTTTTGWAPSCACPTHIVDGPRPQLVLDPFIGSGTTALVARKHGRRCIGIDLSAEYLAIAAKRTQQLSLLGGVA